MKKQTISRSATWLTFGLFIAILFFDFADQALLNPLLNPLLTEFFNNTDNVVPMGWISFTFTILSSISMIIAGIMADKTTRLRICFAGSIIYSIFSILTFFTPEGHTGYIFFFITRALNGIGIGAIVPTIFSMVGDTASKQRRTIAFSYISVAMMTGRMAGFVIAGASADKWRIAYLMLGLVNLILAFGLLILKEPQRGAQEEELKELILEGAEYRFRITRKDIKHLWANRSNVWLVLNFVDVIPGSIVMFLIFKYMSDIHNLKPDAVNIMILAVALFGVAGTLLFGRMGDWGFKRNRKAKVLIALFCNAFPILFMFIFLSIDFTVPDDATVAQALAVPGVLLITAMVSIAIFINQGVNPNWYSSLTDINLPEHRATMISIASFTDMMGNALGPLIGSYFATIWGIEAAMWSVLGFWFINIFFWLPVLSYITKDMDRVHQILETRAKELKR